MKKIYKKLKNPRLIFIGEFAGKISEKVYLRNIRDIRGNIIKVEFLVNSNNGKRFFGECSSIKKVIFSAELKVDIRHSNGAYLKRPIVLGIEQSINSLSA